VALKTLIVFTGKTIFDWSMNFLQQIKNISQFHTFKSTLSVVKHNEATVQ